MVKGPKHSLNLHGCISFRLFDNSEKKNGSKGFVLVVCEVLRLFVKSMAVFMANCFISMKENQLEKFCLSNI